MALSRQEIVRRYRKNHPERFTAEFRRPHRKVSDELYRATADYQKARKKYVESGKKKLADMNHYLKCKYGKTLEEKQEQYHRQQGLCGLCGEPLPEDISRCHWDHDHQTGKMRDLLHKYCNQMLGWIENDLHDTAIDYLERHANE